MKIYCICSLIFIDNVNFARAKELGVLFCEYYVLLYITLKLGHRSFIVIKKHFFITSDRYRNAVRYFYIKNGKIHLLLLIERKLITSVGEII